MSKYIQIRDVCDVFDGPHATPKKIDSGPVYLGIDAVTDDGKLNPLEFNYLSEADYKIWTKRVTPMENDIVFSYEATLGRYALIPKNFYGCLGRRLGIVRVRDTKVINPKWLYYYFLSPEWTANIANNTIKGSTVNRISVEDFPNFQIPYISIEEQDKIVEVLEAIDEKIDNNNRIIAELINCAEIKYSFWFNQYEFPVGEGKTFISSKGKCVWSEKLKRNIPEGWQVGTFADLIAGIRTGLNPRDNFKLGNGDISYITVKNLTTLGTIDFSNCDTVDEIACKIIHKRSDVSKGDILFASIAPLGRCYYVKENPKGWDINESVFSIRTNENAATSEFLYLTFMSDMFIKGATSSSTGSIFKGIRINTLLDMETVIPPKSVIDFFTKEVEGLLELKEEKNQQNIELYKLRKWLMPQLFSGTVEIK